MEHLEDIVTSIECPDPLPKNVHRQSGQQNSNGNTPTCNEHDSRSRTSDPVIEKIREPEEHEVFERDCSDERLH